MNADQAKALRAPFKPNQIGKLPKPTKRENPKGKCPECGGWHGLPAVHLDYVGHAACTDRLLEVDPEWTWKPMARGPQGEPLLVNGGLWIELTVCGVTRPGFGDDTSGKGMKEIIGDAIRNASMRFGVALDLWSKEDLGDSDAAGSAQVGERPDRAGAGSNPPGDPAPASSNGKYISTGDKSQQQRMWIIAKEAGVSEERVREIVAGICGPLDSTSKILRSDYDAVISAIQMDGVPFG